MVIQCKSSRVCGVDEPMWERVKSRDLLCVSHCGYLLVSNPACITGRTPIFILRQRPLLGLCSSKPAVPATLLHSVVHVSWQEDTMLLCSSCFTDSLLTYLFWRQLPPRNLIQVMVGRSILKLSKCNP